jgi:hypothetical protein
MIYAFKKRKSFSKDARCGRSILNDAVDLHIQAADHHRNLAGIGIRQQPVNIAEIRPPSPESGQPRFWRPIWPDLARPWPESWPALAREAGSGQIRPAGRNPATFAGIRPSQISTKLSGIRPISRILAVLAEIR